MIGLTRLCLNCEGNTPIRSDELIIAVIGCSKTSMHFVARPVGIRSNFFTRTVGIGSKLQDCKSNQ